MKCDTKIVRLNIASLSDDIIEELLEAPANCLRENGTVAFPTETVYGLGANALDESAIAKIYEAKGRPSDNPLIVHIADVEMLRDLVSDVKPYAYDLMREFWPGPITFVFKKRPEISARVSGGLKTIAVRMPDHEIAKKLIAMSGKPIAAPSANLSGKPSPTSSKYVIEDLMGRVDYIIDGGDTEVGLESTVLDVTGESPVILRPGKITKEQIETVVNFCGVDPAIMGDTIDDSGIAKSPGMKYKHYAPEAEVHVFVGSTSDIIPFFYKLAVETVENKKMRVGIMTFSEDVEVLSRLFKFDENTSERVSILSTGTAKDWSEFGRKLFDNLRVFDTLKCDIVFVRGVDEVGLGHAIMNRLKKASEGKVTRI